MLVGKMREIIVQADLNYNSYLFFFFLIGFLLVYFLLCRNTLRRYWILLGNLVFYAWDSVGGLCVITGTAVIAYLVTRRIEAIYNKFDDTGMRPKEKRAAFAPFEKRARRWIAAGFVIILGIWIVVKIGKLIGVPTVGLTGVLSFSGIIVPLGISYYTLCTVAYVMDVYWQKTEAEHNFFRLFTAMTYFPYIVQGPFVRYQNITKQFNELPGWNYQRVCSGLQRMLWGYIKKLVIADRLLLLTNTVFNDPTAYAGIEIILAVILAAFQLYADFSGCMDIIRGISEVIGIELPENFRQPFFAKSAAEFWRRWHISLGDWTKEYIYLPIAMNSKFLKKGREIKKRHGALASKTFSSFFPLFSVWLFTGLWHGTGLDYICWGMYWGLIIIVAQITEGIWPAVLSKLKIDPTQGWYQGWRMLRTFLIFTIGRMWTLTGKTFGFFILWKQIFAESRLWILTDGTIFTYGMDLMDFIVIVLGIAAMLTVDVLHENKVKIRESIAALPLPLRWAVYYGAIFVILIIGMYGPGYDAASFVYGNF